MEFSIPPLDALPALLAAVPEVDGMFIARVASRVVHVLSAIVLGGGLFYVWKVLAASGPEACFAERRAVWAKWVGIVSLLLIVSGLFNFWTIYSDVKAAGDALPPLYHGLFGVKVLLALAAMFLAATLAGKTTAADRLRTNIRRWSGVAFAAVTAIVIIGAMLRMLHNGEPTEELPQRTPVEEAA